MNATVTVLMSSYNGEKYIEEQIESILAQKGCCVRLIVRDDGSSDGTKQILKKFYENGEIEYYEGENLGPAYSFLTMIKEAPVSEYYAFSDQDDIWFPEKLIRGIELIKNYNTPAVYSSNMRRADERMRIINERALPDNVLTDFASVMTVSGRLFGCTMVFNREMASFIKKRELPQNIIMHDLWLAMIASLHDSLIYDKNPYINYRSHSNSVTFSKNIPIYKKIKSLFLGSKESVSQQCRVFVDYTGIEKIKQLNQWYICDLLLNYKRNLFKKVKLQMLIMSKKDMSFKLRVHRTIQILFGKY